MKFNRDLTHIMDHVTFTAIPYYCSFFAPTSYVCVGRYKQKVYKKWTTTNLGPYTLDSYTFGVYLFRLICNFIHWTN